jgi:hypothetical protein
MSNLTVGDRVGYSAAFLRSTGQYTGTAPFRRGVIRSIYELTPGFMLANVQWDFDREPSQVNIKNLARVGTMAWAGA